MMKIEGYHFLIHRRELMSKRETVKIRGENMVVWTEEGTTTGYDDLRDQLRTEQEQSTVLATKLNLAEGQICNLKAKLVDHDRIVGALTTVQHQADYYKEKYEKAQKELTRCLYLVDEDYAKLEQKLDTAVDRFNQAREELIEQSKISQKLRARLVKIAGICGDKS